MVSRSHDDWGNFIGPLLGGYAASAAFSYEVIFLFTAFISVFPLLLILPFDFKIKEESRHQEYVEGTSRLKQQGKEFINLLRSLMMRRTVIAEGISTGCITSYSTFIFTILL